MRARSGKSASPTEGGCKNESDAWEAKSDPTPAAAAANKGGSGPGPPQPSDGAGAAAGTMSILGPMSQHPGFNTIPGFLTKSFDIFSNREFADLCGWGPDGDTIIIYKIPEFSARVLPRYFKHSNFQSFVRQLNMYDFHKTVQDPSHGEFQHQYFQRDRPDLLHLIKRKASHANSERGGSGGSGGNGSSKGNSKKDNGSGSSASAGAAGGSKGNSPGASAAGSSSAAATSGGGGSAGSGTLSRSRKGANNPVARAVADAWPDTEGNQGQGIATHTDAVVSELVKLQQLTRRMEHRIVELEVQNRHANSANSLLWRTLQKHSAAQMQMQTKMHKIVFFLYHAIESPEIRAQLELMDSDIALSNEEAAVRGLGQQAFGSEDVSRWPGLSPNDRRLAGSAFTKLLGESSNFMGGGSSDGAGSIMHPLGLGGGESAAGATDALVRSVGLGNAHNASFPGLAGLHPWADPAGAAQSRLLAAVGGFPQPGASSLFDLCGDPTGGGGALATSDACWDSMLPTMLDGMPASGGGGGRLTHAVSEESGNAGGETAMVSMGSLKRNSAELESLRGMEEAPSLADDPTTAIGADAGAMTRSSNRSVSPLAALGNIAAGANPLLAPLDLPPDHAAAGRGRPSLSVVLPGGATRLPSPAHSTELQAAGAAERSRNLLGANHLQTLDAAAAAAAAAAAGKPSGVDPAAAAAAAIGNRSLPRVRLGGLGSGTMVSAPNGGLPPPPLTVGCVPRQLPPAQHMGGWPASPGAMLGHSMGLLGDKLAAAFPGGSAGLDAHGGSKGSAALAQALQAVMGRHAVAGAPFASGAVGHSEGGAGMLAERPTKRPRLPGPMAAAAGSRLASALQNDMDQLGAVELLASQRLEGLETHLTSMLQGGTLDSVLQTLRGSAPYRVAKPPGAPEAAHPAIAAATAAGLASARAATPPSAGASSGET